jgi:hypothetical protein
MIVLTNSAAALRHPSAITTYRKLSKPAYGR